MAGNKLTIEVSTIGEFVQFLRAFPPETKLEFLDPDTGWNIVKWKFTLEEGVGTFEAVYDGEMITHGEG